MTIKTGKTIIPYGVYPEPHEQRTARFFNDLGYDVEFLVPVDKDHIKTPDIKMNGLLWEIKAPKVDGKYTIQHACLKASRQSENIIFDLRRSAIFEKKAISQLNKQLKLIYKIKNLLIITKSLKLIDLKK
jgi:hypothetical protein